MNEAEKKAAALPPKLTVPMILFFLPVLFVVIMTPALIQAPAPAAPAAASSGHGAHAGHAPAPAANAHAGHAMPAPGAGMGMGMGMGGAPHANDVDYDAFLANDRTLDDPQVVRLERGGRARLRLINGATATVFFIDTGALEANCVAVDGSPCMPHRGRRFPLAQGQRIDLVVTMPPGGGAFPIYAQVEDDRRRTGLVLATPGAQVSRLADMAEAKAPHADLSLDLALRAPGGAPPRTGRVEHVMLGEGPNYAWTLNGASHGNHTPIRARLGERVEFMFMNPTSMMHPMHLHGHHFQVVGGRGGRFAGPVRDTVIVPPHSPVFVSVRFDKPGGWFLHCHHLYHMAGGMMTEVIVA
jgi:FtsP/CotA-like multicopper oxidase with cupredoxin domain